jgi:hypothetical protein
MRNNARQCNFLLAKGAVYIRAFYLILQSNLTNCPYELNLHFHKIQQRIRLLYPGNDEKGVRGTHTQTRLGPK